MAKVDSLIAIIGAAVDSEPVRAIIAADQLVQCFEPDLEEGERQRSYLSTQRLATN